MPFNFYAETEMCADAGSLVTTSVRMHRNTVHVCSYSTTGVRRRAVSSLTSSSVSNVGLLCSIVD